MLHEIEELRGSFCSLPATKRLELLMYMESFVERIRAEKPATDVTEKREDDDELTKIEDQA